MAERQRLELVGSGLENMPWIQPSTQRKFAQEQRQHEAKVRGLNHFDAVDVLRTHLSLGK
jgi:hypothetical protein